ncbi:hypothetical protein M758_12G192100 [Ceratodon purpureus]|nr:hypothetical protein M758_12G192100 [Ceratodon purpureus]
MLQGLRDAGQPLFASSVRTRIRTLIETRQPQLLQQEGNRAFKGQLQSAYQYKMLGGLTVNKLSGTSHIQKTIGQMLKHARTL